MFFYFIYILLIFKYYNVSLSFTYRPTTTKMDSRYLNILANFYQQIKEQQAKLQQIQAHFHSTSALPFNYIHPTITLLSDLKAFLPRMIHMHERDTMCMARQYLIIRKPHLDSQINCAWCCRCHSPTCIYD